MPTPTPPPHAEDKDKPAPPPARKDRLADALRQNLRRRKAARPAEKAE